MKLAFEALPWRLRPQQEIYEESSEGRQFNAVYLLDRPRPGWRFPIRSEQYFDLLKASRVLVYWFALMLDETASDLELATRAYSRRERSSARGTGS